MSSGQYNDRFIKLSNKQILLIVIITFFIFATIIFAAFELMHFSNTFDVKKLVSIFLVLGLFLGLGLGFFLSKKVKDKIEKTVIIIMCTIFTTILMPIFGHFTNRTLASEQAIEQVKLSQVNIYGSSRFGIPEDGGLEPEGFHIFIIRKNKPERIRLKENIYEGFKKGANVELPTKKGLWGFDFVAL